MSNNIAVHAALATSEIYPTVHPDDAGLVAELRRYGIDAVPCVWDDPSVRWDSFDAVVFRSMWDYFKKYESFLDWLRRLDEMNVWVGNSTDMARWNSDKRYLLDLERGGVSIIPTIIVPGADLRTSLEPHRGRKVVVKPTVSGTAWYTQRGIAGSVEFQSAVASLPSHLEYLIQPFMSEILTEGEISLIYFGGEFSHAVRKVPASGDYRVQGEFGGQAREYAPGVEILTAAEGILDAVKSSGYGDPLYARVDGVISCGNFLLMELELIEPLLHLRTSPKASARFASLLAARLGCSA